MFQKLVDKGSKSVAARAVSLGLIYFVGAELGHALSLATAGQSFATFWPPAGVLLVALVASRVGEWPRLLSAAVIANLASDVFVHDKPWAVAFGFSFANGAEACVGAVILRRCVTMPMTLGRLSDVMGLAGLSAVGSTMVGATMGAAVATIALGATYSSAWKVWWIGDALGVMVVAPVVLAVVTAAVRPALGVPVTWRRRLETLVLFAGLATIANGVYGQQMPFPFTAPALMLPFALWVALRFEPSAAAFAVFVVAIIGMWHVASGRAPAAALSHVPLQQLMRAQGTLAVFGLSILLLAAEVAERKRALAEVKTLRGLLPICAWCKKIRDDVGFWQHLETYLGTHTSAKFTHGICPDCVEKHYGSPPDGGHEP